MIPRGYAKNMDIGLITSAMLLIAVGLLTQFSLEWNSGRLVGDYFIHQLAWIILSLIVGSVCWILNYKIWDRFAWLLYIVNIVMLIGLLIMDKKISGAASWFKLGFMSFQPSEFAKLLFVVTFAGFLSRYRQDINTIPILSLAFLQFLLPFGLIMLQPDLGTALVFVFIFFGMLFVAGVDWLTIFLSLVICVSSGIAATPYVLKDYQFKRITAFLNPESNPLGTGYQLIQSKIAIGSGGFLGKGIFNSTQAGLGFLPTAQSDFVFSTICEQAGFVGGVFVIGLLITFLSRVMRVGGRAEDMFAMLICAGVFSMIAFQAIINIGMTMGLFPITGIPLPFVSYGGSSLLINAVAVGLLLNISVRRRKIMFV